MMKLINFKSKIILFIILVLIINIFSTYAEEASAANAAGTAGGTTTGTPATTNPDTSLTNSDKISAPNTDKERNFADASSVLKDGKPGDVLLNGGSITKNPSSDGKPASGTGGDFKAGGEIDINGKKTDLGESGNLKSKGNEISEMAKGSEIKISEEGRIKEADIIGNKEGTTKATLDGRDAKLSIGVPKDAELTKKPGVDYELNIPKGDDKSVPKLEMPKVEKKKPEEEDKESYNPLLKIYSEGLTQLPDEVIKAANLPAGTKFQTMSGGALIYDSSNGGQWQTQGKVRFVTGEGKELFTINNMGKMYNNANERSYLFFGKDSVQTPEAKSLIEKGIAGVVVDGNNKFISSFSTNDKLGTYVELGEGNHFNGYRSSIMPEGKSGVSIQEGKVQFQGNGIFYGGQGIGYSKEGNSVFFKEGADLKQIFPNGGAENFAASNNFKASILPLDNSGNLISDANKRLYVEAGIENGKATNRVIGLDEKGYAIGGQIEDPRVRGNVPGSDSGGKPFIPAPSGGAGAPAEHIQPQGNAQQNAMSSTARLRMMFSQGGRTFISTGTGTVIGVKGDRAFIITAAHVVAEGGMGVINVEIFDSNSKVVKTVQGQVVNIHPQWGSPGNNDLAMVSIPVQPGMAAAKVAPLGYSPQIGEPAFNIGCSHGADATCRIGSVRNLNAYIGNNIVASMSEDIRNPTESPEVGRSGGGLFRSDGKLIGVLSARTNTGAGSYAGTQSIQQYLDRLGLSDLYKFILSLLFRYR